MKKRVYTYAVVIHATDKLIAFNKSINPNYNEHTYPRIHSRHASFEAASRECKKKSFDLYRWGHGNYFYALVEPFNERVSKLPRE